MASLDSVMYLIVPSLDKKAISNLMGANKQMNSTVWEAKFGLIAKMVIEGRFYYDVFKTMKCKYAETLCIQHLREGFCDKIEFPLNVNTSNQSTKEIILKVIHADMRFYDELENIITRWPNSYEAEKLSSGCGDWFIGTMRVAPVSSPDIEAMQTACIESINTVLQDDDDDWFDSGYDSPISPFTCSECGEEFGSRDYFAESD